MSEHPTASMDGVAKTPTTTYIQIVLCRCKMESCALCSPIKDDLGLLYLERLLWVHNKFGGMIAVQVHFFSLALHCTWMGIKNTGVKYMLKKPHPQLSSGPFAYIEKKMAFTYLNAEMLSWSPSNGIRIP
jgi:hypothetical protein